MTDVWTSVGVLVAIGLVAITGWLVLDPIIAIIVGLNILFTGYRLVRRSVVGLLDGTLPPEEVAVVNDALHRVCEDPRVEIIDVRTRESGRQRFVYATLTVPGSWTVKRSHDVADQVEDAIDAALPGTTTFVHIEPAPE
jgi:cation diffusion facilitator family transporter